MKKKIVIAAIISLLIVIVELVYLKTSTTQINKVVDVANSGGNFYCIKTENERYHLYKLNSNGVIVEDRSLMTKANQGHYEYTEIEADDNGNAYVLVVQHNKYDEIVSRYIQVFNSKLEPLNKLFESNYTDLPEKDRLFRLEYVNQSIICFEKNEKQQGLKFFKYDTNTGESYKTTYEFEQDVDVWDIIYTSTAEIYYLNGRSELFHIDSNNKQDEVKLAYSDGARIIPYKLSSNTSGDIFFTDAFNFCFSKYDPKNQTTQIIYNKEDYITAGVEFKDIRDLKYVNEKLIAHTPAFQEKNNFIITIDQGNSVIIHQKTLGTSELFKVSSICFLIVFVVAIIVMFIISYLITARSLLVKQVVVIVTLMMSMTLVFAFVFKDVLVKLVESEIYAQLYTLSSSISASIDTEQFKNVDFIQAPGDSFYNEIDNKMNFNMKKFYKIKDEAIVRSLYYTLYFVKEDKYYVAFGGGMQNGMIGEYLTSSEEVKNFIFNNPNREPIARDVPDMLGNWMVCETLIVDANDQVLGYVEVGTDQAVLNARMNKEVHNIMALFVMIAAVILILLLYTLKTSLKGLDILKQGVNSVTDGNWKTEVAITTNDEIEDIGNAFNKMSRKITTYVDYIEQLNGEYEKFIPNEIFKLLNKNSIMEIKLGDQVIKNMCIMKISTKNFKKLSEGMSTVENFEFLNKLFGNIAGIIKQSGGIVEDYEGAGLRAMYPQSADNAIDAALKVIEKINGYNQSDNVNVQLSITILNGDTMLGIVGDMERREATIVSEIVNSTFSMERIVRKNAINLLISGNVYEKIVNKNQYNFRYIGKIKNQQSNSAYIDLYDGVDAYSFEDKENKLLTKENFELGVEAYIHADFVNARKCFIDVVRIDSKDETAKTYIFLCDKYLGAPKEEWEGIIADNFI